MPADMYVSQSAFDKLAEVVWILWNRDGRSFVIDKGGIKVLDDGVLVGTVGMVGGTSGLGYQYDGSVTSAAAVAALHKATLEGHTTELSSHTSTLASHSATLSAHGTELSNQAGSILGLGTALGTTNGRVSALESSLSGLASNVSSLASDLSGLSSTVGGLSGLAGLIEALDNTNRVQNMKLTELENRLDRLDGGGGPTNPGT